ncbi:MAG: hypothetical protein CMJ45_01130 [Planctomyces sp.]|nr:hypothetical protein [Planctomyces sp.]
MPRESLLAAVLLVCALAFAHGSEPTDTDRDTAQENSSFWAFRRLAPQPVPEYRDHQSPIAGTVRNPIDAFILRDLEKHGLTFSRDAQPARLVRRAYFDLVGLPPSPEATDAFLRNTSPSAYERLIDRLSASPHFGERWGRHWLDVVGYTDLVSYDGDTTGIFGFIQDRWRYRDYVIDAFNNDKPYDLFLAEQIAGDELVDWRNAKRYTPEIVATLSATGFWRNAEDRSESAKELEYKWSFLHNTMQTFGTGVLGLTLRCARCHDHKHEPIPQRDYYRLLSLITPAFNVENWKDPKQRAIPSISASEKRSLDSANAAINKQVAGQEAKIATIRKDREQHLITSRLKSIPEPIRDDTRAAIATPADKRSKVQAYLASKFADRFSVKKEEVEQSLTTQEKATITGLQGTIADLKRRVKSHGWIQAIYDVGPPPATHLLERGEFKAPGPQVQPGFLDVLSKDSTSFVSLVKPVPGSSGRRMALSRWLTKRDTRASGLVARVMVNRVWQHLTGVGIVATSENLGMSGDTPTHPELLDWLAAELVNNGWRIKPIIKRIMMSTTYRQASRRQGLAVIKPNPRIVDPGNRLLWRARLRRLESEVIRDSMLATSERFNSSMGGQPVPLKYRRDGVASFDTEKLPTPASTWRRSVYLFQRRVYHLTVQGVFDQPTIAGSVCRRKASAVALQSLSMLNDSLALEQAEQFAQRVWHNAGQSSAKRIELAFRIALSRAPDSQEVQWSSQLLRQHAARYQADGSSVDQASRKALMHLCRVLFNSSEFLYVE